MEEMWVILTEFLIKIIEVDLKINVKGSFRNYEVSFLQTQFLDGYCCSFHPTVSNLKSQNCGHLPWRIHIFFSDQKTSSTILMHKIYSCCFFSFMAFFDHFFLHFCHEFATIWTLLYYSFKDLLVIFLKRERVKQSKALQKFRKW